MSRLLLLLLAGALALPAADNALTAAEKRAGWRLLFDGKSFANWRDPLKKNVPGDAWVIENGCLKTVRKARISEDLVSAESFGDFELAFDWKLSPGGNTGVKYRHQSAIFLDFTKTQSGPGGFEGLLGREIASHGSDRAQLAPAARGQEYTVAFEMQLLDDERHGDAKSGEDRRTGSLYRMLPRTASAAHPAGEWNTGKIVVRGKHVEHWVNGVKVLDGALDDPRALQGIRARWKDVPRILDELTNPKPRGPVSLQHHGDEVWFKNVKIRPF